MRISKLICLATIATCLCTSAIAQKMYRCGSTFSEQPCGPDAKAVELQGQPKAKAIEPMPADLPVTAETIAASRRMCEAHIIGQLKDPDSARFDDPIRQGFRRTAAGTVVRDYLFYVNAKNSYGGYTGAKRWACSLNATESVVVWSGPY